jgi:hypothetical protein
MDPEQELERWARELLAQEYTKIGLRRAAKVIRTAGPMHLIAVRAIIRAAKLAGTRGREQRG